MVTISALIIDGKYKLGLEGVYFLAFVLDLAFVLGVTDILS